MSDHFSVNQISQWAPEVTPGVAVAATKKLPNYTVKMNGVLDVTEMKSAGSKYVEQVIIGDESSTGSTDGLLSLTDIVYPLSSIVGLQSMAGGVPTQQNTSSGYLWSLSPNPDSPDTLQTFSLELGDTVKAYKFAHVFWNDWSMKVNRKDAKTTGSLVGQMMSIGSLNTSGVTSVKNKLVQPKKMSLWYGSSFANIFSGTRITRGFEFEFKIANRRGVISPIDDNNASFAAASELEPDVTAMLKLGADRSGSDFVEPVTLVDMRAGAINYVGLQILSDQVGTPGTPTISYKLTLGMALIVNKPFKLDEVAPGLQGVGWDFRVANDITAAKPYEFKIINEIAAL